MWQHQWPLNPPFAASVVPVTKLARPLVRNMIHYKRCQCSRLGRENLSSHLCHFNRLSNPACSNLCISFELPLLAYIGGHCLQYWGFDRAFSLTFPVTRFADEWYLLTLGIEHWLVSSSSQTSVHPKSLSAAVCLTNIKVQHIQILTDQWRRVSMIRKLGGLRFPWGPPAKKRSLLLLLLGILNLLKQIHQYVYFTSSSYNSLALNRLLL